MTVAQSAEISLAFLALCGMLALDFQTSDADLETSCLSQLLISGSMSMGRSSRDPAASILKSEHTVESERSSRTTRTSRINAREGATEDIWERLKNKGLKTDDSSLRKRHMDVWRHGYKARKDGLP